MLFQKHLGQTEAEEASLPSVRSAYPVRVHPRQNTDGAPRTEEPEPALVPHLLDRLAGEVLRGNVLADA